MNKIKIITDSTSDLNYLYDELDIKVLPLSVIFGDKAYLDGVDINTQDIYDKVKENGILPKTAAIVPSVIIEEFKKWYDEGYDVIFTGISSKMSSTYQSAVLAAKEVDESGERIFVVDSGNLSTGIGLLLCKAAMDRDKGLSAKEIVANMEYNVKRVKAQFAIETMEYLHKGGRCSGVARIFGTLLKIKPIIFVRDGSMTVGKKPLGKMTTALNAMLKMLEEDKEKNNVDPEFIFVTDSIAEESRAYLVPKVKELFPNSKVYSTVAGGVIASHCGPGTIGILYICKDEVHL